MNWNMLPKSSAPGQAIGALAQFADAAALYKAGNCAEASHLIAQAANLLAAQDALAELAEHSPGYGERAKALLSRLPEQA